MKRKGIQKEDGVLKVIHDDKIEKLLRNLELLESVQEGKVKCKFCKEPVRLSTINGIFPESNTIKISCDKPECVLLLSEYLNEKNV
ncbi:MAG: hypothetical protein H6563_08720 [Lewinellaceae bacterium]|nr:hypothetical protein [Lewinellaceae bacterium]